MGNHFCTCTDLSCTNHPHNHNKGCDPCIQKNLARGEIPGCFFRRAHDDLSELTEFTMESFSNFFQKYKEEARLNQKV